MTNGHLEYLDVRMRAADPRVPATIERARAAIAELRERGYRVACNDAQKRLDRILRDYAAQERAEQLSAELKAALLANDFEELERICDAIRAFSEAPLWLMERRYEAEERLWDREHPEDPEFLHPSMDDIVRGVEYGYR